MNEKRQKSVNLFESVCFLKYENSIAKKKVNVFHNQSFCVTEVLSIKTLMKEMFQAVTGKKELYQLMNGN